MRLGPGLRRRVRLALRRLESLGTAPGSGAGASPGFGGGTPSASTLRLPPVFTGGTGRSGTTIAGRLLDAHPDRHMITQEVRFISAPGGLCDLVEGRTTLRAFEERVAGTWFERRAGKGLYMLMDRETLDAALAALRAGFRADPWGAAAAFAHGLLDPLATAAGAAGWVETTPANVIAGPTLLRLFPDMRLIHSVRDGRDVACSVVRQARWGPTDLDEGLEWWADRLEKGFAATASMPPDRVLTIQLEELVVHDRDREYARLLAFLGMADDPAMRDFFEQRMAPEGAHVGRWREDVPPDRLAAFESHYARLAAALAKRRRPYRREGTGLPG